MVASGSWVDAGSLRPGAEVATPGGHADVLAVRSFTGNETMHNLTVADLHTYYVVAGGREVAAIRVARGIMHEYRSRSD